MAKSRRYICLISAALSLGASAAATAKVSTHSVDDPAASTVVIVGKKRGATIDQAPPRLSLKPADIQAYGAGSVGELLDILKSQTRSASGKPPVVLLNGHRVSGFNVLQDIPPEAVVRIDTFTEATALAYGYPSGQMVVNIVLAPDFRGRDAEATQTGDFRDTGAKSTLKYSHLNIGETQRINLSLNYKNTRHVLESDRDVVTESNDTNLAPWRTAIPDNRQIEGNLSFSRTLFDSVEATLEAFIKGEQKDSRLGLANGSLTLPASNPFATSAEAIRPPGFGDQDSQRPEIDLRSIHVHGDGLRRSGSVAGRGVDSDRQSRRQQQRLRLANAG